MRKTIDGEATLLAEFVELLQREQASLAQGAADDLPQLADRKNSLVIQLNQLSAQRAIILEAHGLSADRAGIDAWCVQVPDVGVADTWQKVLQLAAKARELNRVNGELIQIRMQFTSKALEALSGAKNSLELYGPDGQSAKLGSRRINDAV
ncbi:MAG: flagellar protein FlgN [Propionivibrio sp.]